MSVASAVEPAFRHCPDSHQTFGGEVADLADLAGFAPDPEQKLALDMIFAVDRRGKSVAFEFCAICCRQNLKTGLFKQAALGWLFITDERLIVWSAHEFNTAQEAHRDMANLIDGCAYLSKRVKQIYNSAADRSIELTTGQRLVFKARTNTGGRGLSAPKVVLDEAFALKPEHMGALLPTLSVQPDPQVLYGSSAGMADSAVLRGVRDRGRVGRGRLAYLEWCAPEDSCDSPHCTHLIGFPGCALDKVENWQAANPLLGRRRANGTGLTEEYIRAERDALPPMEFARERLGWWDKPDEGNAAPVTADDWRARIDSESEIAGAVVFAAEIALDRKSGSIAVAGRRPDGAAHVGLIEHRKGIDWVLPRLLELANAHPLLRIQRGTKVCPAVVVDPTSPAGTLVEPLRKAGIEPVEMHARDVAVACAGLQDAVRSGEVWHRGQPAVESALSGAIRRDLGDGGWAFGRKKSAQVSVDITPLVVVTNALWGLNEAVVDYDVLNSVM